MNRAQSLATQLMLLPALAGARNPAQAPPDIRAPHSKMEVRTRMRDGVQLFTAVYVPRDITPTHPIVLTRTPYRVSPYGPNSYPRFAFGQNRAYVDLGYILVLQDVRGRFMSEEV